MGEKGKKKEKGKGKGKEKGKKNEKEKEELILLKRKLPELIENASKEYAVVAPVPQDSIVLFKKVAHPSEMTLDFSNTAVPPKAFLLPQTETLFTFSKRKPIAVASPSSEGKTLIVGVRPCDAKSLAILDPVFQGEYKDPFVEKRENTVVIGLNCTTPGAHCFCTSLEGSPFSAEYTDVQLTDIGEKYYVQVSTEKGRNVINLNKELFESPTKKDERKKKELEKKAQAIISRHMHTENITDRLENMFEDVYWRNIARKCLGCGACTFVCPTCHCFDMQDESTMTRGARVRVWDSCMYPEYTEQASGYNPRPERMNRVRNRVYHKYNYYPKTWDIIACVGCGRCVSACPVNIDIIEVINATEEVEP